MTTLGDFELNDIYNVNAIDAMATLPDMSVDLILCDPIYENIDDYRWLSQEAARVLKPTGAVLAQVGELFWIDAQKAFYEEPNLAHMPPIIEVYYFSTKAFQVGPVRISSGYTPYIFAMKQRRTVTVMNRYFGKRDKTHHEYGDGVNFSLRYIDVLCPKDGVVLDPFAGGGTVSVAAKLLGRNHLAFEINPVSYARAKARIDATVPFEPSKSLNEIIAELNNKKGRK